MSYRDIRAFLDRLREEGELVGISEELSPYHEISAICRRLGLQDSPAVLFERVKGYDVPAANNLLGTRRRLALAFDATEETLQEELGRRRGNPIPPRMVAGGPVKEVIHKERPDVLKTVPVLTYHEKDVGPYITQGLLFIKDPETGARTMGIHRHQVKGGDRLGVWLASPTSSSFYSKAEERGQPLDCAIAIGVDPAILMASVSMSSFGDKLSVAGGLRGEAVELTKAETVEVEVPAHAMFVIEGQILPRLREPDGPFGESSGYYIAAENLVIKVSAITHQRNPIYTFFQPLTREEELLLEVALGRDALNLLKMVIPSLQDVAPLPIGAGLVISIQKTTEGEGRQALQAALSASDYLKYAIAVDDDVDVHDPKQVAWALYGRFQPDRDILILQNVKGSVIDPSVGEDYLSAKMGLDATKPLEGVERFERAVVPQAVEAKIAPLLQRYFGL